MFVSKDENNVYILSNRHPISYDEDMYTFEFDDKTIITELMDDEIADEIFKLNQRETVKIEFVNRDNKNINENAAERVFQILDDKLKV